MTKAWVLPKDCHEIAEYNAPGRRYWWKRHANAVKWRTARVSTNLCAFCTEFILSGERYLDTGEKVHPDFYARFKACRSCALTSNSARPIPEHSRLP